MNYVGIDLGTTNSAICSYDGENVTLYKSPETHDVTPSAIFIDRRNNKYVGSRAYNNAARNPESAATLFKRLMGTSTPVHLKAAKLTMSPEECSAEILKTLFGYLPDEIRNDDSTGTVITVPAAFNQMQKDATMAAANAAHIGRVGLMQEPVAAVMSVMRQRKADGVFLIYDLGGGTLDIAIAEGIAGRVSLLSHGGIEMCGGRDFDRSILAAVVKPWLLDQFELSEDFDTSPQFKTLTSMSTWASEKSKIELSQRDESVISLPETELGVRDLAGNEIYLDVAINRSQFDRLIASKVDESIDAARQALAKAGLSSRDVERIVFVGGPTHYRPLRDRVATALGIAPSTDVNPMTAVAEGAAVFAESIEWSSASRGRKSGRGVVAVGGALNLSINFLARTPDSRAKIVVKAQGTIADGSEIQVDSLDTGWSSGRFPLKDGCSVDVALSKPGENTFKVFVFASDGRPLTLNQDRIVISRTAASIDAIPASHSIALAAQQRVGGSTVLDFLVREGDQLPKKGRKTYKAAEAIIAGSSDSLRFPLWEGEVDDPIEDNRFIGLFKISGSDFETGVIPAGGELVCDFEVRDSGQIHLEVTVPAIGAVFPSGHSFYSRQEGQIDYTNASRLIASQSKDVGERLDDMSSKIDDPRLDRARERLSRAAGSEHPDPETAKQALDDVQEARRLLAQARKANLNVIRQLELDNVIELFNGYVRQYARPSEISAFENLCKTAQRTIQNKGQDFESHIDELRGKNFAVMWRQDWFVIDRFKRFAETPHLFPDGREHAAQTAMGTEALNAGDVERLRQIVAHMDSSRFRSMGDDDLLAASNIIRG
jgi:molecular chaperone DnaK